MLCLWLPLSGCQGGTRVVPAEREARGREVMVTGIMDGDTVKVRREGVQVAVRLEGIDAPERKQAFGAKAKEALGKLLEGKEVRLVETGKDRYGRTLGRLLVAGSPEGVPTDVCVEMVRLGFAWHFTRYNRDADLAAAQREAVKAKRGLWADKDPVAPWVFRKTKKKS